jgi:hypothetical protein
MRTWYLWVIPFAFCWPLIHLAVFSARFGSLPPGGVADSLVFLPMSLVSGAVLAVLVWRARSRERRISTVAGYLAVSPCAFCGSLMSGLSFSQPTGTLIYGAIPLIVGTSVGYLVGRAWDHQ